MNFNRSIHQDCSLFVRDCNVLMKIIENVYAIASISRKNDWNQKIFTRAEAIPLVPGVDAQKKTDEYKKRWPI